MISEASQAQATWVLLIKCVGQMFAIVATALTLEGEKFFTKLFKGGFPV
jgi:hypothetical protein